LGYGSYCVCAIQSFEFLNPLAACIFALSP
jgi:hypothetical protein